MIKAVLFDIDGVLVETKEANVLFLSQLFKEFGCEPITKEQYEKAHHLTMKDAIRFFNHGIDESKVEEMVKFSQTLPRPLHLYKQPDNAYSVLKELSQKYKLAVVTNRVKRGMEAYFEMSGTKELFVSYISCEDVTHYKPHPEPLLVSTEKMDVRPEECVYVGDSHSDFLASKNAGMKFIAYSKTPIEGASITTDSFQNLPDILQSL